MSRIFLLTTLCASLLFAQLLFGQDPVRLNNTNRIKFPSAAIGDTLCLDFALPGTYASSKDSFRVVYLLDSDILFGMARDMAAMLTIDQEIPRVIVVGISYGGSMRQWFQKRSRDFTPTKVAVSADWPQSGGGEAFRTFLKTELIPYVDKNYRTIPNDRTVVGLSAGGLFATYVLLTDAAMFMRYITISPYLVWDNKYLFDCERTLFSRQRSLPAVVYTAIGLEDKEEITKPWSEFNATVASRKYQNLVWHVQTYAGDTHLSVFPGALAKGLKFVFSK